MKPKVFVTRLIPEQILAMIEAECDVEVWREEEVPPIAAKISSCDGLLTYGHEPVTGEIMALAPNLKVIANMGVGYNHIDIEAGTARGISVGNTPGVLNETTADHTFALLFATARNVVKGDRFIRCGGWEKFDPNILWGAEVTGATLGIIGLGRIGQAIARRAKAFDMRILYYKRQRLLNLREAELGATYVPMAELLAQSDFVVVMTPLTEETRYLIGRKELAQMKNSAILINTARGPIVDPQALYEALRDGVIAGAALDVFDPEPPASDDPLLTLDNIVLTPHLGSATVQTRIKMALMTAQNLLAGLKGQALPYWVNPEVQYTVNSKQ